MDTPINILEHEGRVSISQIVEFIVSEVRHKLNQPVHLGVKRLENFPKDWLLPHYATEGSACFDLRAIVPTNDGDHDYLYLNKGGSVRIHTGLAFEIPEGYVMKIYSRSGHGFKNSVTLRNNTGIIDSDYTGEIIIGLRHHGEGDSLIINHGDRIAQAMLVKVDPVNLVEINEMKVTKRGSGGFGSTGVN